MDTKRTSMTRFFNPYLAFASLALLTTLQQLQAQITSISIEPVLVHDGQTPGLEALDGYTTYHIYANLTNELDFVSSVYGDAGSPMILQTTGDIFQSAGGTNYGSSINLIFLPLIPDLACRRGQVCTKWR